MNTTFLKKHLARATSSIGPTQVARIAEDLDEKCRTIKF